MTMKRGRPSAEDKAAAASKLVVFQGGQFANRPEPTADLNARQQEIWRETVRGEPAEFFATAASRGALADYCGHRDAAERLGVIINEFKAEWLKSSEGSKRYAQLLNMRDKETRAASRLATRLRLTNQSRYRPDVAATASRNARGIMPWEE